MRGGASSGTVQRAPVSTLRAVSRGSSSPRPREAPVEAISSVLGEADIMPLTPLALGVGMGDHVQRAVAQIDERDRFTVCDR